MQNPKLKLPSLKDPTLSLFQGNLAVTLERVHVCIDNCVDSS